MRNIIRGNIINRQYSTVINKQKIKAKWIRNRNLTPLLNIKVSHFDTGKETSLWDIFFDKNHFGDFGLRRDGYLRRNDKYHDKWLEIKERDWNLIQKHANDNFNFRYLDWGGEVEAGYGDVFVSQGIIYNVDLKTLCLSKNKDIEVGIGSSLTDRLKMKRQVSSQAVNEREYIFRLIYKGNSLYQAIEEDKNITSYFNTQAQIEADNEGKSLSEKLIDYQKEILAVQEKSKGTSTNYSATVDKSNLLTNKDWLRGCLPAIVKEVLVTLNLPFSEGSKRMFQEKKQLEAEIKNLLKEKGKLQDKINSLMIDSSTQKKDDEIREISSEMSDADKNLEKVKERRTELNEEIFNKEKQKQTLENAGKIDGKEYKKLLAEVEELRKNLTSADQEIEKLRRQTANLKELLNASYRSLQVDKLSPKRLVANLSSNLLENSEANKLVEDAKETIASIVDSAERLEKEEKNNVNVSRQLIAKEEEKAELPTSDEHHYQELIKEVEELRRQLKESREIIIALQDRTSESKNQLKRQCRVFEEQIKEKQGELKDLKKDYIKKLTDRKLGDVARAVGITDKDREQKESETFSVELDDICKKQVEIIELEEQFKNVQKISHLINLNEDRQSKSTGGVMSASVIPPQLLDTNDKKNKIKLDESSGCEPNRINYNNTYPHDTLKQQIREGGSTPLTANDLPLKLYNIKKDQEDLSLNIKNIEELTTKHVKTRAELLKLGIKNYATLSYVWGKVENRNELTSLGRKSLTKAVKACQYLGIDYLWIDQLCINQQDRNEKEEEVKKMRKCYGNSAVTLVSIQTRLTKKKDYFSLNDKQDELDVDLLSTLKKIYVSEWFSRSWTFQEGFLSKQTVFMFDDYLIDGRYIAKVWALNQPSYVTHAKYNNMEEFISGSVKIATPVGWAYYKDGYKKEDEIKLKLHEALRATKDRHRGIPVDAIYSILGLLPYGEQVEVKYKERGQVYEAADVEKALLAVMKVAVKHGEPLSWHGVANSSSGLCWMPEVHYDKKQAKKKNGSMKVQGGINISYKGKDIEKDFVFSEKGIKLNNCLELVIEKVYSDTTKVENGFLIDGGVHMRDVLVNFNHDNYQKISLLGTKETLAEIGNDGVKMIMVDKELWHSDKDFALLVKRQGDTYHRLGLVEFLMKSEELEKIKNLEKKEITIGMSNQQKDHCVAQVEFPPKNY